MLVMVMREGRSVAESSAEELECRAALSGSSCAVVYGKRSYFGINRRQTRGELEAREKRRSRCGEEVGGSIQ